MPIFEYRCKECDTQFEKIIFSSSQPVECPKCKSKKTDKLLSSFSVNGGGRGINRASSCGPRGGT